MMTGSMARLRQSGSFIAGALIGISIVVATFAVTDNGAGGFPTFLALASLGALLAGFALQALVTFGSWPG